MSSKREGKSAENHAKKRDVAGNSRESVETARIENKGYLMNSRR